MTEQVRDPGGVAGVSIPSMCSVCLVREQRDGDDFVPCSPACYQAALRAREKQVIDRLDDESTRREEHGFADGFAHGAAAMKRKAQAVVDYQRSKFKARDWDDALTSAVAALEAATVDPE